MAARPLAALSSHLLARPGHAKPAMRPQGFAYATSEDLGWNDMGRDAAPPTSAPIAPVPAPAPAPAPVPPVLTERAALTRAVASAPEPAPAISTTPTHRAAFTLRLDPDRHLRLRLASAVAGRSSQQLLIDALDAFLTTQPQVEALARQVPAPGADHFSGEKPS